MTQIERQFKAVSVASITFAWILIVYYVVTISLSLKLIRHAEQDQPQP